VADSGDDSGHPQPVLLDLDGRYRDQHAGRVRHPNASRYPAISAIAGFVKGTCFVFWSFGTWWIPLLIVLGLWRHVLRQWPLRYDPSLWTVVFPIGMYGAATLSFGKAADLSFMEPLSRGVLWVAIAAWLLVAAAGLARLARRPDPARHASDLTGAT
jgi:tellurite resistance protein TehA-like permease